MSFECQECKKEVSNSEMVGLAIGYCTRTVLEKKLGVAGLSKGELSAGFLNGMKVPCPKCGSSDWKFN